MTFFNSDAWIIVGECGYLQQEDRRKMSLILDLFLESPSTDTDIEGTVVGIVSSYTYNSRTQRAIVTLVDETGVMHSLIDSDIITEGGLIGYVEIGVVIVAKTTTLFTLSEYPKLGCIYITNECIVAIVTKSGEVVPGVLFDE